MIACVALALANDYYLVLGSFFFIGMAYASDTTNTSVVITDFTPLSKRWIIPLLAMSWTIGSSLVSLLSLVCNIYGMSAIMVYRVFCMFAGGFHILSFIIRFFSDESPRFLLATKQFSKAEKILTKMARLNKKEITFNIRNIDLPTKFSTTNTSPLLDNKPHTFKSRVK